MVATRAARKRRVKYTEEEEEEIKLFDSIEETANDSPEQFNGVVEDDEEEKCFLPLPRKKRKASEDSHHATFQDIPRELLPHILSFLDDSNDVYTISKCSKYLRDSITPEIVIRSAVFAGGTAQKAIANIMQLVENRSIHMPSTHRLLRLVSAKRCERGSDCTAYNLLAEHSAQLRTHEKVSLSFGLAFCSKCRDMLCTYSGYHTPVRSLGIVASDHYSRTLGQAQFEACTGDPIGPILFTPEVSRILNTYSQRDDQIEALTNVYDDVTPYAEKSNEEQCVALVQCHQETMDRYSALKEKKAQTRRDEIEAKRTARCAKKEENVQRVIKTMKECLEGYQHKGRILQGRYLEDGTFKLRYGPARAILGSFLAAPSKASKKKIVAAVQETKRIFDLLEANNFFNGRLFEVLLKSITVGFRARRSLIKYCQSDLSAIELLTRAWKHSYWYHWNESPAMAFDYKPFMSFIEKGDIIRAIFSVLTNEQKDAAAVNSFVKASPMDCYSQGRKLARNVWDDDAKTTVAHNTSLEMYTRCHSRCYAMYKQLRQNYYDYINDEETQRFLSETRFPRNRLVPLEYFDRQDAIDTVLDIKPLAEKEALRERDFETLLEAHRYFFQQGRKITAWW